jgi:hypothetical protein
MKDGSSHTSVNRVSGEIDQLRGDIGNLVAELDRRRHEMFDLRLQAKRHPVLVVAVGAGAALVLGALVALSLRSRRERRRPVNRAREVRGAMARLLDHPDRVGAEMTLTDKVLGAAGVAAATALAKRLVDRMIAPAPPPRAAAPARLPR